MKRVSNENEKMKKSWKSFSPRKPLHLRPQQRDRRQHRRWQRRHRGSHRPCGLGRRVIMKMQIDSILTSTGKADNPNTDINCPNWQSPPVRTNGIMGGKQILLSCCFQIQNESRQGGSKGYHLEISEIGKCPTSPLSVSPPPRFLGLLSPPSTLLRTLELCPDIQRLVSKSSSW